MDPIQTRNILEACLLVAGKPMSIRKLSALFEDDIDKPGKSDIRESLTALQSEYEGRGIELVEVASGWRLQSRNTMEHWVGRLFEEKPPRYSRALLETLVLIAYRQPVTRGEIEEVRGVAVSSNIIRTLQERQWIREVGHKDVPGRPALLGTTSEFLDYFNLKELEDLPPLGTVMDMEQVEAVLAAEIGLVEGASDSVAANDETGDAAEIADPSETRHEGETLDRDDEGQPVDPPASDATRQANTTVEATASDATRQASTTVDPPASDATRQANDSVDVASTTEQQDPAADPTPDSAMNAHVQSGSGDERDSVETDATSASETSTSASDDTSDARARLRQVIDRFASEHQQEVDARDEFESRHLPRRPAPGDNDGGDIEAAAHDGSEAEADVESVENEAPEPAVETRISESVTETESVAGSQAVANPSKRPNHLRIVHPDSRGAGPVVESSESIARDRDSDRDETPPDPEN